MSISREQFTNIIETIKTQAGFQVPKGFGIGVRRSKENQTLDVSFPVVNFNSHEDLGVIMLDVMEYESTKNGFKELTRANIVKIIDCVAPIQEDPVYKENIDLLKWLFKYNQPSEGYSRTDIIVYFLFDDQSPISSTEEAYFKLHCTSQRQAKPSDICLDDIFKVLPNLAWTNKGPVLLDDLETMKIQGLFSEQLVISHIDKFPYLVNYTCPSGVRIASGSQVRLGAYLGEGTTVMPAGYVNFNSCIEGNAMIEGRVSSGVTIAKDTDIGGGASIMGVLSGGNDEKISIGSKCLLGANSGTGISLGFGCTVAAGTYITAGSKVSLYNSDGHPVDLNNNSVEDGQNVAKGRDLSGKDKLLIIQDSVSGKITCRPNPKTIELNTELHDLN